MSTQSKALFNEFAEQVKKELSLEEKQFKGLNDLLLNSFTIGLNEDDIVIEVWKVLGKI